MSRLWGGIGVGITMLALCGAGGAAEQSKVRPNDPAARADGAGTPAAGSDASRGDANEGADADVGRSPEHNAALRKCDAMTGTAKTRCVMEAEKKHSAENRRDTTDTAEENAAGNQAYSADLQKCDAMSGAEKTRCVSAAKRKHGHM